MLPITWLQKATGCLILLLFIIRCGFVPLGNMPSFVWKHLLVMRMYYYENISSFDYVNQSAVSALLVAQNLLSAGHMGLKISALALKCHMYTPLGIVRVKADVQNIFHTQNGNSAPGHCKLDIFLLQCQFKAQTPFSHFSLQINDDQLIPIPRRDVELIAPTEKRHRLVFCPSRIYNFERWQLLITVMELYASYGVQLTVVHVYSVVEQIHALLRRYQVENMLALRPYITMPKDLAMMNFNPNMETPFSTQQIHMMDCLLAYKQSTDYIIMADWDDIVHVPAQKPLWSVLDSYFSRNPNVGAIYVSRFDGNVPTLEMMDAQNKTLFDVWRDGIDYSMQRGRFDGKSIVRPEFVTAVEIHRAISYKRGYGEGTITAELLHIVHSKCKEPRMQNVLPLGQLTPRFIQRFGAENIHNLLSVLPKQELLVSQVNKCFDSFSGVIDAQNVTKCPTSLVCTLKSDAQCLRAESKWNSVSLPLSKAKKLMQKADKVAAPQLPMRLVVSFFQGTNLSISGCL